MSRLVGKVTSFVTKTINGRLHLAVDIDAHTFGLFWAPIDDLPDIIEPQNTRLAHLHANQP